jgi:hypothetical protein
MTVDISRCGHPDHSRWSLADIDLTRIEHEQVRDDWFTTIWSAPPSSKRQPISTPTTWCFTLPTSRLGSGWPTAGSRRNSSMAELGARTLKRRGPD